MGTVSLKNNKLLLNFQDYLQSQIIEMGGKHIYDQKGQDITAYCEHLMSSALLLNAQLDLNESNFAKLSPLVDMAMTWVKYLTNGLFILQKE